jgi:FAD/FMN-containing dehydrogenase
MFHRVPAAVLRPRSVQDIVAMVRYANQHRLKVAIRGDGHSRYGQTQAEAGVVIDSRSLNAVRVRTPHSADAVLRYGAAPFRGRQSEIRSESRAVTASGSLWREIGASTSTKALCMNMTAPARLRGGSDTHPTTPG